MTGVILMSTKKENGNFCSSDDSDKKPKLPKSEFMNILLDLYTQDIACIDKMEMI